MGPITHFPGVTVLFSPENSSLKLSPNFSPLRTRLRHARYFETNTCLAEMRQVSDLRGLLLARCLRLTPREGKPDRQPPARPKPGDGGFWLGRVGPHPPTPLGRALGAGAPASGWAGCRRSTHPPLGQQLVHLLHEASSATPTAGPAGV